MWIAGWLWSQGKGNWPHLNLILGTPNNFAFLGWHQGSSRLVTVLLGTLWSSIKQIDAPYVFDWENAIALETMQGNRASCRRKGNVSCVFSSCGRNLVYILELQWGCPFETLVCSLKSGTCLVWGTTQECKLGMAGKYRRFWKLSGSSGLFFFWHSDIGIPNYIKKLSGIVKIWSSELHVAF